VPTRNKSFFVRINQFSEWINGLVQDSLALEPIKNKPLSAYLNNMMSSCRKGRTHMIFAYSFK
jgi:hypothetical protein